MCYDTLIFKKKWKNFIFLFKFSAIIDVVYGPIRCLEGKKSCNSVYFLSEKDKCWTFLLTIWQSFQKFRQVKNFEFLTTANKRELKKWYQKPALGGT